MQSSPPKLLDFSQGNPYKIYTVNLHLLPLMVARSGRIILTPGYLVTKNQWINCCLRKFHCNFILQECWPNHSPLLLGNVTGCTQRQTPWHSSEHSSAKSKNATVTGADNPTYIFRNISQDSMIRLSMRKTLQSMFNKISLCLSKNLPQIGHNVMLAGYDSLISFIYMSCPRQAELWCPVQKIPAPANSLSSNSTSLLFKREKN